MAGDCTLTMGGKRIWVICYFLLCTGGVDVLFLLSEMSLTLVIPQFRSIIPCEVLLYIEVTFLGFIH